MIMTPCASSQIKSHGYDPISKTLAIEYHSGDTYHYDDVPPEKYEALSKAESVGKFFHSAIKGNHAFSKAEVKKEEA